ASWVSKTSSATPESVNVSVTDCPAYIVSSFSVMAESQCEQRHYSQKPNHGEICGVNTPNLEATPPLNNVSIIARKGGANIV
ncbi:hypothetical protein Q4595_27630, partial [Wenyingzhuangia sp. 1_MG-2023]|nr:hypothetical protein [Wenyingzhuangia sp. 1_MG-2023]